MFTILNMQNIPDKDFDNIFKKAAENHKPQYNPKAWTKMEKKIDAAHSARWTRIKTAYLAAGLLLIGGSLWFSFSGVNTNSSTGNNAQKPDQIKAAEIPERLAETGRSSLQNYPDGTMDSKISSPAVYPQKEEVSIGNQEVSVASENEAELKEQAAAPFTGDREESRSASLHAASARKPDWHTEKKISEVHSVETERTNEPVPFKPYVSLSFRVSPDFSGLGLTDYSQTGSNTGITASIHLSRRISFQTGFIHAKKVYSAINQKYGYGYSQNPQEPDEIRGDCHVIDIPVNIRYNFATGRRHNFFLSTGFSSYLMRKEDYNYIYNDHPYYNTQLSAQNENQHFFSIYNLSAGYELALSRQWSVMIEPFVKVPLTDIGAGNLRLHSSGIFISVNYSFKQFN